MSPKKIVIIGGSNTGLMTGIALSRLGHQVTILEQNVEPQRQDQAAGITTHPEFEEFMQRHDRLTESWSLASPGIQFLDREAAVKRRIALKKPLQLTSWSLLYQRLRANFDGSTTTFYSSPPPVDEQAGPVRYEHGQRVTDLALADDRVEITHLDLLRPERGVATVTADYVVVASGAGSALRAALFPGVSVERVYAGYVAFRGTVPDTEVSDAAKAVFGRQMTYFSWPDNYILMYIIPGADGSLAPGHCRYNWVWYHALAAESEALGAIMTDAAGILHRNTLPAGSMDPKAWAPHVATATTEMCPPFAELVAKTRQPFVTAISDMACPRALALDGRAIVVGEALAQVRPHMALSTTQGAAQALLLERVFAGQLDLHDWEATVLRLAQRNALKTNAYGTFFLYGWASAAGWLARLLAAHVGAAWPLSLLSALPRLTRRRARFEL